MKKLQYQLKTVSKTLTSLANQVDRIYNQVSKLQTAKSPSAKKAKSKAPGTRMASAKNTAASKPMTVLDTVYDVVRISRKGVTISTLKEKTELNPRQLSNALYRLSKKGKIKAQSRGVYTKK